MTFLRRRGTTLPAEADRVVGQVRVDGVEPTVTLVTDGRDLDPALADLTGTGASQRATAGVPDRPMPGAGEPMWTAIPSAPRADQATYYDQPIVKAPPWGPAIPAYIVLGGAAGAAATLAAVGGRSLGRTQVNAIWLAAAAGSSGALLLMSDLGRPERAMNMFRVLRPTSPMSLGAYVLAGCVGASGVAAVLHGQRGPIGRLGSIAGVAAGALGVPLAGYTGVLLASTALPGWSVGMRTLPPLFMGSAVATAGSALTPFASGPAALAVDVYRTLGQATELIAEQQHERAVATVPGLDRVYAAEAGWRIGRWLTLASLLAGLLPGVRRRRVGRLAVGAAGVIGSVATKAAVFEAGMASAADPHLTTAARSRP